MGLRPALQELVRDIRSPARGWDTLLTLDTSRLSRAKPSGSPYLLTPLLQTPDGEPWTGDRRRYYRLKGKRGNRSHSVPLELLQEAVLEQILVDAQSPVRA
jgi:hypothetical protein